MERRAKKKYGWHILHNRRQLRDGQVVEDGVWVPARQKCQRHQSGGGFFWRVSNTKRPHPCRFGMHACDNLSRAMDFGNTLHASLFIWVCRVLVEVDIFTGYDKFVGRKRRISWSVRIRKSEKYKRDFNALRKAIKKAYKEKYGKELRTKLTK